MFPDEIFDPLLSSITVQEPVDKQNYACYEAIPLSFASDETKTFQEPAVRLWHRTDSTIQFERFIVKLGAELKSARHPDNQAIVGSFLTLFAIHPQRKDHPTAVLNRMLSKIADSDLSQFFIFPYPPHPGFEAFRVGHFLVGALDSQKLHYRSSRAGSDYFDRYGGQLRGRIAIERDISQVRVLDIDGLSSEFESVRDREPVIQLWNRAGESYFQALAATYFEEFWELLMEEQNIVIALGSPYVDRQVARTTPSTTPVSVFMKINGTWGHVAAGRLGGFVVDFASIDRRMPRIVRLLKDEYHVEVGGTMQPTLKSYTHFLSKAGRYLDERLADESFLHYVIALELLFGERTSTAESVSRRVATIVFRPLGLSIGDAKRRLEKLYDARSRYVHEGRAVEPKFLDEIKVICQEVLHALLRRLRDVGKSDDMSGPWLKDIDYVFSALDAGKSVQDQELVLCGIRPTAAESVSTLGGSKE